MSSNEAEFWERANQARDRLSSQFLGRPEVSLIDIGYAPQERGIAKQAVLRVHVRKAEDQEKLGIPSEMDGIPVIVIIADYRLE